MAVHSISAGTLGVLPSDGFVIIDANILVFLHAGYAINPTHCDYNKFVAYSNLIGSLLKNRNIPCASVATVQEVFHVIEATEYKKYCSANSLNPKHFNKKNFRSLPAERQRIEGILKSVYRQIKGQYSLLDIKIKESALQSFVDNYHAHSYDPIDYIMIESFLEQKEAIVVTDDKDFQLDSRLTIYTY